MIALCRAAEQTLLLLQYTQALLPPQWPLTLEIFAAYQLQRYPNHFCHFAGTDTKMECRFRVGDTSRRPYVTNTARFEGKNCFCRSLACALELFSRASRVFVLATPDLSPFNAENVAHCGLSASCD
ncbi:MAG: hypothetical protein AAF724_06205 [Pseudomonadota bacterium]